VILIWLLVWWIHNFPAVYPWNIWFITLIISLVLA
jgi:hypothetical protein